MRHISLLGNFNARAKDEQTMFDTNKAVYGEVMAEEVGLKQQAEDMSEVTEHAKHFLTLGNAHGFVIYNDVTMAQIRCFDMLEPKGRCKHSVDYLMRSPSFIRNRVHYLG